MHEQLMTSNSQKFVARIQFQICTIFWHSFHLMHCQSSISTLLEKKKGLVQNYIYPVKRDMREQEKLTCKSLGTTGSVIGR